jgi:hypothetical protein
VNGYYEYTKGYSKGMQFISRGRNWIDGSGKIYSINNGNEVDYSAGILWTCVDLTIDEKYYSLSFLVTIQPQKNK